MTLKPRLQDAAVFIPPPKAKLYLGSDGINLFFHYPSFILQPRRSHLLASESLKALFFSDQTVGEGQKATAVNSLLVRFEVAGISEVILDSPHIA